MWQRVKTLGGAAILLILGYFTISQGSVPEASVPQWGYIDRSGTVKIPLKFSDANEFSEGLAAARVGEKWGYIDPIGEFVIPPQFSRAAEFSEGLAMVSLSSDSRPWEVQFGYIDKTGSFVIPSRFNWAASFSEGLAGVCEGVCGGTNGLRERKVGFIDRTGEYVIEPDFVYAGPFSEGLADVSLDREGPFRFGYVDRAGTLVIPAEWWATGPFRNGLAATSKGYINKRGTLVILVPETPGGHVGDFSDGLGVVRVADESIYYDASGGIALKTVRTSDFAEGLAAAFDHRWFGSPKWGYIDKSGKSAIPYQWDLAESFSEGLAAICSGCRPFD